MMFETEYTVTEELQRSAAKQLFFTVYLKKKWISIGIFGLVTIASAFMAGEIGWVVTSILGSVTVALIAMWVKTYFVMIGQSKDYLKLVEDPVNTFKMDEDGVEVSNSNGMRRVTWEMMDGVEESRDFLIPMTGKLPAICLPKNELSTEAANYLRNRSDSKQNA